MSNLELVITALQEELDFIHFSLNRCLAEQDYSGASYYQNALVETSSRLRIIKNLKNPYCSAIEDLEFSIKNLKTSVVNNQDRHNFLQKLIVEKKRQLKALKKQAIPDRLDDDRLLLEIERLLKSVDSNQNWYISIKINFLTITVQAQKQKIVLYLSKKNDDFEHDIKHLRKLGFVGTLNHQWLDLEASKHQPLNILTLLSRICYEVYKFYGDEEGLFEIQSR